MSSNKSELGKKVVEYIEQYPSTPNRTLARVVGEGLEISIDKARDMIRYYRGVRGDKHRKHADPTHFNYAEIKAGIPKSDSVEYTPFIIPKGLKRGLILSDIHLPYHDIDALAYALEDGKSFGADLVILNGDVIDCYQLSSFVKDPTMRDFSGEINIGRAFFKLLREIFPKAYIVYKFSNHEARLETYFKTHAPALFKLEEWHLSHLLGLKDLGIEHVKDKRIIQAGKLSILHGDEYTRGQSTPIGPARNLFVKAHDVALCAHFHRTSEYTERSIMDKTITCWSTGALCELHPDYARLNSWNHGYALITLGDKGAFTLQNKRIGKDHEQKMMRF